MRDSGTSAKEHERRARLMARSVPFAHTWRAAPLLVEAGERGLAVPWVDEVAALSSCELVRVPAHGVGLAGEVLLGQPPVRATQPCDPGVPVLAFVGRPRLQPAPHHGPNDQVDPRPPRFVPSLRRQGGGDGLVTDPAQLGKVRLGLAVGVLDCLRQDALLGRPKTVATSHVRTVRVSTDREQLPTTSVRGDVLRCERGGYTDA